jgi:hypothetical protein
MPPPNGAGICWYWPAKIVFADPRDKPGDAADLLEHHQRFARRVQGLALPAGEDARPRQGIDDMPLVRLGDRRKAHDVPILLRQHVADQIVLVQPVHDLSRDCRRIVASDWYRHLFPTRLSPQRQAAPEFETTAQGCRLATSVGGVLTGRGADIIIIDDPLKPEEALSEAHRQVDHQPQPDPACCIAVSSTMISSKCQFIANGYGQ